MSDEIRYVTMKLSKAIRLMEMQFLIENSNKYLFDISDSRKIARKLLVRPSGVTGFRTS